MTPAEEAQAEVRGGVTVELNGEKVLLFFPLGAQIALQKEAGIEDISTAINGIAGPFDAALWRAVLWAGQLHANPDLQISDLDNLKIRGDDAELRVRVMAALQNVEITEEELKELGEELKGAAEAEDPFALLRMGAKLVRAKMGTLMNEVQTQLAEIVGSQSSEQQTSSASPLTNSGNSPPANSTGDSGPGGKAAERKTTA